MNAPAGPAGPAGSAGIARFTTNQGVRLHYLDHPAQADDPESRTPNGRRPAPVLFVPGLTDVAEDYLASLASFGRRVVVVDLRGRGRSDSPATGYTRDDHVSDLEAVLDAAGIDAFHLATFSRGTAYGLALAVRHPHRVRTITVGDYIAGEIGIAGGVWPEAFVAGRWRGTAVLTRISEVALREIARESVDRRYWDELRSLAKPLQVLRGGRVGRHRHEFVDADSQARYRAAVPGAHIVTFDESDHDLFRPDPTRYPRLVAELARLHDPEDV